MPLQRTIIEHGVQIMVGKVVVGAQLGAVGPAPRLLFHVFLFGLCEIMVDDRSVRWSIVIIRATKSHPICIVLVCPWHQAWVVWIWHACHIAQPHDALDVAVWPRISA